MILLITNVCTKSVSLVTWILVLETYQKQKNGPLFRKSSLHPWRETLAKGCIATPSTAQRTRLSRQKPPIPQVPAGFHLEKNDYLEYSSKSGSEISPFTFNLLQIGRWILKKPTLTFTKKHTAVCPPPKQWYIFSMHTHTHTYIYTYT